VESVGKTGVGGWQRGQRGQRGSPCLRGHLDGYHLLSE
jgi:hypothetical protein